MIKALKIRIAMLSTSILMLVGAASAALPEVNWTEISDFVAGVADVFPGLLDLIVAVVPVILVIAIVGLVTGLFDKILGMMKI